MKGVAEWLASIGLERYAQRFVENAIDGDVLAELTEGDLEKLGIPLGDRKRLIKAIRAMLADSRSALTTRLILASFGIIACATGAVLFLTAVIQPAIAAVWAFFAAVALADLVVVARRKLRGEPG